MFLFKHTTNSKKIKTLYIYITICFYLNENKLSAKFTTSYLHYNMFLFKCAFNGTITDKRFNLHYSMFLFKYITFYKLAQLLEIYITPLCQVLDTYFFQISNPFSTSILTATPDFSRDY